MSGDIKISGVSTGIDFETLVTQLVEAERYQSIKLTSWKKDWQEKIDTLQELSSRVSSLQTANNTLKASSSFISRTADTTNSDVADITVDSSSSLGSYKFEVADGTKHKTGSVGLADDFTLSADQTLTFDDGDSKTISVLLLTGMTSQDIIDTVQAEITAQGSNAKIELTQDGSDLYSNRIVITSATTGKDGTISFTSDAGIFNQKSLDLEFEGISPDIMIPTGSYTGHISKRINFTVTTGGTLDSGNVKLQWEDPTENKSGTVTINDNTVTLFQGLSINITDNLASLNKGDQFSLDVSAPDIQLGQDRGVAQSAQLTHTGLSSTNAYVTTSDSMFSYSYAGVQSPLINVPANTTLEDFAKLINESAGNPGVKATIINDGMGTAQSFHLVLTGNNSGAANQVTVTQSTLTNMNNIDNFETTRRATNAMVKIDDYPQDPDSWIQKSSNLITDLINGASIKIKDTGIVNFTISNNENDMAEKVQSFVDEYNSLLDYIDEITKVVLNEDNEADIDSAGVLVGNYAVNILKSTLRTYIGERADGFDADSDTYSLLTQVGLSTNDSNRLEFDIDVFKTELNENPSEVIQLFSADKVGSIDNNNLIYMSGTSETKAGIYDFTVNYVEDGFGGYTDEIASVSYTDKNTGITYDSTDNKDIRIATDKKSFTVFGGSARGVAILNVSGSATEEFTLAVKQGKAISFDEELTRLFDDDTGLTKILEKNYETIIENIDRRIEREESRVLQVKKRLELKFANLEVNLSNWNSQMESLQSQISSLPSEV